MGNLSRSSPLDPVAEKCKEVWKEVLTDPEVVAPVAEKCKEVWKEEVVAVAEKSKKVWKEVLTDPEVVAVAKDILKDATAGIVEQLKLGVEELKTGREEFFHEFGVSRDRIMRHFDHINISLGVLAATSAIGTGVYAWRSRRIFLRPSTSSSSYRKKRR